ncbi:ATP-binding protein [Paenibacillus sp. J5C2022]|uniref:ATP-binding protein n=1 Tax=Paenibacillus sp. J5C2022 TaxID=2977129 RepID=UPI0021D356E1|nr:ATP-binding protein [Paenibacillus sp. J5C2022]
MNKHPIVMTLPAIADNLGVIRSVLYTVAAKAGFSYEEIEDMKVAVTEACSNVIQHAYRDQEGFIRIAFQWMDAALHISVKDDGSGVREEERAIRQGLHAIPLVEASVGGLGIYMMHALMDKVEVKQHNGTEVVLIKRLGRIEEIV